MNKIFKFFIFTVVILSSSFFLSACGKKNNSSSTPTKTSVKKSVEIKLADNEKPIISLVPTTDGHTLNLKISSIPSKFSTVEYELIYTAKDGTLEIEKGVSGTVKPSNSTIEKDLLLGTASCTNGCKYKYDEGVNGGTLNVTLKTDDNQYASFETPFTLTDSTSINKTKKITIEQEGFTIEGTTTTKKDFFVAVKNYNSSYSVFSNGDGKGKITSITPSTVTKSNMSTLTGDYKISQ
jgi:hypothetical protein